MKLQESADHDKRLPRLLAALAECGGWALFQELRASFRFDSDVGDIVSAGVVGGFLIDGTIKRSGHAGRPYRVVGIKAVIDGGLVPEGHRVRAGGFPALEQVSWGVTEHLESLSDPARELLAAAGLL